MINLVLKRGEELREEEVVVRRLWLAKKARCGRKQLAPFPGEAAWASNPSLPPATKLSKTHPKTTPVLVQVSRTKL